MDVPTNGWVFLSWELTARTDHLALPGSFIWLVLVLNNLPPRNGSALLVRKTKVFLRQPLERVGESNSDNLEKQIALFFFWYLFISLDCIIVSLIFFAVNHESYFLVS